jgi:hypothetical protein
MRRLRVDQLHGDEERAVEGERISDLATDYAIARKTEREAEAKRKAVGKDLLPAMGELHMTRVRLPSFSEEETATVAIKHRETMKIDERRLKKAIGAQAFNKLTTPVLDEAKVEAAIAEGQLDAAVVAAAADEHVTPYLEVRFTKRKRKATG